MTPSRWYRQHRAVEAPRIDDAMFRPGWLVKTRLDGLLAARAITLREWRAGTAYRDHCETAARGRGARFERLGLHAGRSAGDYAAGRLDALAYLRRVRAALGTVACGLIEACAVDDAPWAATARRLGVSPPTARTWTVIALRALARLK